MSDILLVYIVGFMITALMFGIFQKKPEQSAIEGAIILSLFWPFGLPMLLGTLIQNRSKVGRPTDFKSDKSDT